MGNHANVRELESKGISDFRPRLHINFIRLYRHTGDTSANCRIFKPLRFSHFRARSPVVIWVHVSNSKKKKTRVYWSRNLKSEILSCKLALKSSNSEIPSPPLVLVHTDLRVFWQFTLLSEHLFSLYGCPLRIP